MNSRLLIVSAVALSACSSNPLNQIARTTNFAANYASDSNTVASSARGAGIGDLRLKIETALVDAKVTTRQAASVLQGAIDDGDEAKIEVATKDLVEAKAEEDSITGALKDVVEVIETVDEDPSDDDGPSLTVADLDAAEKATEAAQEMLQSYRDKGYGQMDIDEALGAINVASTEEERVRQALKDNEENTLSNNDKDDETPDEVHADLVAKLDAAEMVTDAAREAVEEVKAKGYGQMDIDEANAAFEAAEAEEDKAREEAKAAEVSDDGDGSDDTDTEAEDVTEVDPAVEDEDSEETDVTVSDDTGDTDTGTVGEIDETDDRDAPA